MLSEDDFQYAIENTKVIIEPEQLIETFGSTRFRFLVVTELMDEVNKVRVRDGNLQAQRPRIITPQHFRKMLLEGFGEAARSFADFLEHHAEFIKILRYGFELKKTDIAEHILHEPLESVLGRLSEEIRKGSGPSASTALITGVDDAWEVCLLKFTADLIKRSAGENLNEWKRRGLL